MRRPNAKAQAKWLAEYWMEQVTKSTHEHSRDTFESWLWGLKSYCGCMDWKDLVMQIEAFQESRRNAREAEYQKRIEGREQ